ncbi:MAG: FHA domain-containing protein [Candidatus Sumerlaeia bacterium]|nr:FHA domain-containing protein [Candidatus Sumerlaeia bacterium]
MPEIIVKLGENVVHKYFFDKDILNIGRARDNDIVIENLAVSRNHARIRRINGKYILTDLNSANGTFVNGVRITKTEILHNDVISIGKHNLIFINRPLSDEEIISDAFGADRTLIVDRAPAAVLVVTTGKQKGQEFKLTKAETTIGRANDNDIKLHDWFVSKRHAQIIKQGNNYFIKDLGSWRGIFINGQLVKDAQLKEGDDIKLGATHLTFHLHSEEMLKITGRVPKELAYEEAEEPEIPAAMATPIEESVQVELAAASPAEEPELEVGFEKLGEEEEISPAEINLPEVEEQPIEEVSVGTPEESIAVPEMAVPPTAPEEEVEADRSKAEERVAKSAVVPEKSAILAEIEMWEKALKNKSPIIRREAARMLKKLTGKDYEY